MDYLKSVSRIKVVILCITQETTQIAKMLDSPLEWLAIRLT
jgi:hypothetical protein